MDALARLTTFAAGLAVIAAGAAALGSATHATPPHGTAMPHAPAGHGHGAMGTQEMAHDGGHGVTAMAPIAAGADGTHLSVGGLTLAPFADHMAAGHAMTWRFRILGRDGAAVRSFERDQTKLLHLIVVRSDLLAYQHLHPTLGADGTFAVRLRLGQPGRFRAIADFTTGSVRYALGTTLTAAGPARSAPLPAQSTTASAEGYRISLARPAALRARDEAPLTFAVTREGRPVTNLEPYLGAYGHLVALHAPDLAYSHVHPTGQDLAHGRITFHAELPAAGAYRLFVQFRAGGQVHTAAFTQHTDH